MLSPDLALALLLNRTAMSYTQNRPAYIVYDEYTHVSAPSLGRSQDINRHVAVRELDNFAVMHDLPNGGERTGNAFPIIPYFDPWSQFSFRWQANLKNVVIDLQRTRPYTIAIPQDTPGVDVLIPYFSIWAPRYAPDSTENAPHFAIDPVPGLTGLYVSDVQVDAASSLPSHMELRTLNDDEVIGLDFKALSGHWTIVRGTFTSTEHVAIATFKVIAEIRYENISFPADAPDPRLATPASPEPTKL